MFKVVILGSTGSLGRQTLEVLERYPQVFKIIALAANTSEALLKNQAKKFKVKNTHLSSKTSSKKSSLVKRASLKEADIIVNVLSGIAGISPSLAALKAKKILLLGNKESLFVEGKKIMKLAGVSHRVTPLIPLDSEHNAIFEILQKFPKLKIKKIILPCSGGPFYGKPATELAKVTAAQARKHPRYKMGPKISIESATLINKGLEIIEAHYLFSLPLAKIATAYHQQCKIHGAVQFANGITYAYLSTPDMREHIENALLRAARLPIPKRKIILLSHKAASTELPPLCPGPLKGIELVLKNFKNPHGAKAFLLREEKAIEKFFQNKISFLSIFSSLSERSLR